MILAVDPGSEKCGVAVLDRRGGVVWQGIVGTGVFRPRVLELCRAHPDLDRIVFGSGTGSRVIRGVLESLMDELPGRRLEIVAIPEENTTYRARFAYFEAHPPRFPWSLLPLTLVPVNVAIDDYVAVAIGRRFLEETGRSA